MATFNPGDCVRIGEGADPSLVGMEGTWQGTPSSKEDIRETVRWWEPAACCWVALPDRPRAVLIQSEFVQPCDEFGPARAC